MGMIWGKYDAKAGGKGGFCPGGASLHNCMTPHGPDAETFEKASNMELKPDFLDAGMAFMFETSYILKVSKYGREGSQFTLLREDGGRHGTCSCSFNETNINARLI